MSIRIDLNARIRAEKYKAFDIRTFAEDVINEE